MTSRTATRRRRRPAPAPRHTLRRALLVGVVALTLAVLGSGTVAVRASATADPVATFSPSLIPLSAGELPGSLRGQYSWLGSPSQVPGWPVEDVYYRDQVPWGVLETTKGTYDFSALDAGLAQAQAQGGRFGFRVLAYCPGCWSRAGRAPWTPAWLPLQSGTAIPDWNSETFLVSWEAMWQALGERYDADPRLGWVDVGGYGKWGEWHMDGEGTEISDANAQRVIRAVVDAFPDKHVVINAMTPRFTTMALAMTPRMGLRTDCLGETDMFSLIPSSPALQQVWKTAPVLSEWCGTATTSVALGDQQVKQYHISQTSSGNLRTPYSAMTTAQKASFVDAMKSAGYRYQLRSLTMPATIHSFQRVSVGLTFANVGSAPTYDRWHVLLRLRDARGRLVWWADTGVNLQTLLSGTRLDTRTVRLPQLAPGRYTVSVVVTDPVGYLAPMRLAIAGRAADGSYAVGTVTAAG